MKDVLSCFGLFKISTGYFKQMPIKSRYKKIKIPHFFSLPYSYNFVYK